MTVTADNAAGLKEGRIVAIVGPVVDVEFPPDGLPELHGALEFDVVVDGKSSPIVAAVAQPIGDRRVRAICLPAPAGLVRGPVARPPARGLTAPRRNGTPGPGHGCAPARPGNPSAACCGRRSPASLSSRRPSSSIRAFRHASASGS